jgi:hypothetical protein
MAKLVILLLILFPFAAQATVSRMYVNHYTKQYCYIEEDHLRPYIGWEGKGDNEKQLTYYETHYSLSTTPQLVDGLLAGLSIALLFVALHYKRRINSK